MRLVAAVTIGAAPRPDLTDAIEAALPGEAILEVFGALDDLPANERPPAPAADGYPLTTIGRDGRRITADEAWLAPRVAAAIGRAEAAGASAILLLCAGGFDDLTSRVPLVRPTGLAEDRLAELGARRIGVLVPFARQIAPAAAKWTARGFEVEARSGEPATAADFERVDAIVLDYVGHPADQVARARSAARVPVIDLGDVTARWAAATMQR